MNGKLGSFTAAAAADLANKMDTWIDIGRHLAQCPSEVGADEFSAVFVQLTELSGSLRDELYILHWLDRQSECEVG